MKVKNLLWFVLPVISAVGCAHRYSTAYNDTYVVPAPTSSSSAVRVYPNTPVEAAPATSTVPADEWAAAVAVRNIIAVDPYLKGAARNVDIEVIHSTAILRGTVRSEYDRQELAARVAQSPGITAVDNRLVVALR
jgi:hypothetical protein